MNTIPGFNAELSAYRSRRNYRTVPGPDARDGGVRLQACDLACLGECRAGCADLAGRERAQCLRLCNTQCGCGPAPLQCGPCQCNPQTGGPGDAAAPMARVAPKGPAPRRGKDARSKIIVLAFPGRSTPSAGGVVRGHAAAGPAAISDFAGHRRAEVMQQPCSVPARAGMARDLWCGYPLMTISNTATTGADAFLSFSRESSFTIRLPGSNALWRYGSF